MTDRSDIPARARGKWNEILRHFQIPNLDGKHHACPVTGEKGKGTGRFRFSNVNGRGNYFCACSEGNEDGFALLMCKFGWSFKEALAEVEKVLPDVGYDSDIAKEKDRGRAAKNIQRILRASIPNGAHVREYLHGRGIEEVPGSIRQVRTSYGIDRELDAMVVRIRNAAGEPISLHLTYLEDGKKAAIETPRIVMTPSANTIKGGAVRLYQPYQGRIGVAEGIETALSVRALFGIPVWALLSTGGMESFEWPDSIDEILGYGDYDEKFGGQASVYKLAHRAMTAKRQVRASVFIPASAGESRDWNNQLCYEKGIG